MRETRQAFLANAPKSLSAEERESWWISEWVSMKQTAAADEPGMELADPEAMCRKMRELLKVRDEAIDECKQALDILGGHLGVTLESAAELTRDLPEAGELNDKQLEDFNHAKAAMLWTIPPETEEEIERSINFLRQLVGFLEKRSRRPAWLGKAGNTPGTRNLYVRNLWPLLNELKYSMRKASKILACAFMKAGLEGDDKKTLSNTIYQAIRNTNTVNKPPQF